MEFLRPIALALNRDIPSALIYSADLALRR
ncbi:hypothetical protein BDFB_005170 [Asbolus verrucosus]|uniref:Uncharacterized protein n=1 Tax=Asbolus verrucosus TaxID=1661398 RepID=A0A482VGV9_ASBVE|nr:hypothetical protein BDFB_005170 [Asbolus verrucosus]